MRVCVLFCLIAASISLPPDSYADVLGSFDVEVSAGASDPGGFYLQYIGSSERLFYIEGVGYQPIRPWEIGSTLVATPENSTYLDVFVEKLTDGVDSELRAGFFDYVLGNQRTQGFATGGGLESSLFGGSDLQGFDIETIELRLDETASTIRATVTIYGVPEASPHAIGATAFLALLGVHRLPRRRPSTTSRRSTLTL